MYEMLVAIFGIARLGASSVCSFCSCTAALDPNTSAQVCEKSAENQGLQHTAV